MTLVVSRIVSSSVFIVGDTKLTLEMTKAKLSATQGVIKTKIMSDDVAVSFANNEYTAEAAIRAIAGKSDRDSIARELLEFHLSVEERYAPDFIVATLKPAADLLVIKNRTIERVANAWIGDAKAFQLFRAYETGNRQPPQPIENSASIVGVQLAGTFGEVGDGVDVYTRMLRCMKHVIDDESVGDVGGFAIPVVGSSDGFAYFGYAEVKTHPLKIRDGSNLVQFGSASEGGYAYDIVATGDNQGLSSYFLQGNFGLLYREKDRGLLRPSHLISNVSPIEFEETGSGIIGSAVRTWYADNRILCQRALDKLASSDSNGAWSDANRAIERGGQHSDAWKCRGMVLSKLGKEEQAVRDFEKAVEVSAQDADAWNKLGLSRFKLGETESAIAAFSEAIKQDPKFWRACANRARTHWEAGQVENALRDTAEALVLQPKNARLWQNKAAAHMRLGMKDDALNCIQRSLQLSPDNPELLRAENGLRAEIEGRTDANSGTQQP